MTFTPDEEKLLKLMATERRVHEQLSKVNEDMGNEIRTEFNTIDTRIREEKKVLYEPLQTELQSKKQAIRLECLDNQQ